MFKLEGGSHVGNMAGDGHNLLIVNPVNYAPAGAADDGLFNVAFLT